MNRPLRATGPFSTFAERYRQDGWQPFPLPFGRKSPPPPDVTGSVPYDVGEDLWSSWLDSRGSNNVGLRVPDGVIAVDVDEHDEKHGWKTIQALSSRLGPLPLTVRVTSRSAGSRHGHYLYRVPSGLAWKSSAGDDVEVIHPRHRYLVGAGSVVEGRTYIAYGTDLLPVDLPAVNDLPELPRAWAAQLCLGSADDLRFSHRDRALSLERWREGLAQGRPSPAVKALVRQYLAAPMERGSAYDTMVSVVAALVVLGNEGEPGIAKALHKVQATYSALRSVERDTASEFYRALEGAVQKQFGVPPAATVIDRSGVPHV